MPNPPDPTLDRNDYAILAMVQGSVGAPVIKLGARGRGCFCGETGQRAFQNVAHTFPEAFGNKWVVSLDECDVCNARFSAFDDALVKSMGAILTVGGTHGKGNKVRQTGRTHGPASIRHRIADGKRRSISLRANGSPLADHFDINTKDSELIIRIPGGTERFIPARAYKALVKMAVALLPAEELPNFSKVVAWLRSSDNDLLPHMIVGLSFSFIGNAPPLLAGALLRRASDKRETPYMIFVTTMGSVCLQIVLNPDDRAGTWPSCLRTRPSIRWINMLVPPGEQPLAITYDRPMHLDWARATLELPVIEAIVTVVHPQSGQGRMSAVLRASAVAPAKS